MLALVLTLGVALLVAGCGGGSGGATHKKAATPQWVKDKKYLDANLADQVNAKPGYTHLTGVSCVHQSGRTFLCIAQTSGNGGQNLSLQAVCDGFGTSAQCAINQNP
jgi:hypothetical protein